MRAYVRINHTFNNLQFEQTVSYFNVNIPIYHSGIVEWFQLV